MFTAPCDSSVLYPASGGNIHAFTAITPCAVLDVLGPPYSKEDGRDGSYYKDSPYTPLPSKHAVPITKYMYNFLSIRVVLSSEKTIIVYILIISIYNADVDGSMIKEEESKLYGWLEEIEMPKESVMNGIEYLGPQIREFNF